MSPTVGENDVAHTGPALPPGEWSAREYRDCARRILPRAVYEHVSGAAGDESTMLANTVAFRRYRLRPRIMRDVAEVDASCDALGTQLQAPVFVCPMGGQLMFHKEGERATAGGAAAAGIGYMLSTGSSYSLEEVAAVASPARWFQLYWNRSREITEDLVRRAENAGYRGICLTADAPVAANRPRDIRNGFLRPASVAAANFEPYGEKQIQAMVASGSASVLKVSSPSVTWSDFDWLRSKTKLPLMVKGIMTVADARLAADHGADGLVVSNHGGNMLERQSASIDALPPIARAVGDRVTVMVDGGVRSAVDVLVAVALGAKVVGLGRPIIWALACGGQPAVANYLAHIASELKRTLALMGAPSLSSLDESYVSRAQ